MTWRELLKGDTLSWLSETDIPAVRYQALRDLAGLAPDDPQVVEAQAQAHRCGPIAETLEAMQSPGYWESPGPGYLPKYRSTVWALILLAQAGAQIEADARLERACQYILHEALTPAGQFSSNGAPGGTVDCLQGNLCAALLALGCRDARLQLAFEWMARSVTGEGVASMGSKDTTLRYYAGKCGPFFACGANNKLACAWGGAKVMWAFSLLPPNWRSPLIERAIQAGVDFFLAGDPADAPYPNGWTDKPSGNWWKFGFPVFYITDLLQIVEGLAGLGCGGEPRLAHALRVVADKQDAQGRWPLEYDYKGKTWSNFGEKNKANKWVSLRAVRALKTALP